ncbi:response regulator transcription factor [Bacillus altitudinis]|uniref:response regulator transcription factor n=1 Tax=Bacillus altitudinis TaxID=293387 RepID=UPI00042E8EB6|nr:response regulator transcription factor [Bacillus altitudinis]AHL70282.1 LuxR family transcriptional regulator [Bacillus pumilus]QDZ96554.1 DNA-binding response regulator [Bacillus altitudinis]UNG01599.1 response regulator transcription factor [Bacillus altitudinis]
MKILMIEDNQSVCTMTDMFFQREGFQAEFVHDGLEGLNRFKQEEDWDLLILDVMLPSMDGLTICQKVRQISDVPIIMLTAKETESDQVLGFDLGADDYVTKPFSPLTLMARIKAVKRRFAQTTSTQEGAKEDKRLETEHFQLDKKTREVFLEGKRIKNLTPKEYDLLCFFIQHPRQVFSREQLLEQIWGYQFYGDERTVDVHIKRLRQKIGDGPKPFLYTVWGVGYKFDED